MASTTERIIVNVESEELQRLIGLLQDAGTEFSRVDEAADSVDLSGFNSSVGQLNDNVATIKNLNLAETVKSIGGSFNEVSSKLKFFEQALKDVGEAADNPFAKNLAEAGSAAVGYSAFALEAAGTTIELGAAIAQIVTVITAAGGVTAAASAAWAALSGAVVAAQAAVVAFAATITVATAGIAAAVIAVVAAIGFLIKSFIDAEREAARLTAAINENRDALNEYYSTFTEFTDQFSRLQEAREAADATLERTNVYLARQIALQRESLGLYDGAEAAIDRTLQQAEIRLRYMEQESVQLDIQNMLLGGVDQENIMRVTSLKFQAWYASQTADELERWLDTAPQINRELLVTEEQMGNINASISDFAGGLVGWFQRLGETSEENVERVSSSVNRVRQDIEALVRARNTLEDSLDQRLARVLEDDSLEQRTARQNLYIQATAEQQAFLLQLWEQEDTAAEERLQRELEREQERKNKLIGDSEALQAHLDEQARITADRMAREEAIRSQNLEAFKSDIEARYEMLHGFSISYEEMTNKQIQNISKLTDNQSKALGFTRTSFAEIGAASVTALATAAGEGKSAVDALKATIGQELVARGTAAIFDGVIKTAQGNPMGLAITAAGTAAVAAGAALGASGAKTTATKKSPSTARQPAPGRNSDVSVMNNFGFVSDRRAVAREVADTTRTAVRRGQ